MVGKLINYSVLDKNSLFLQYVEHLLISQTAQLELFPLSLHSMHFIRSYFWLSPTLQMQLRSCILIHIRWFIAAIAISNLGLDVDRGGTTLV